MQEQALYSNEIFYLDSIKVNHLNVTRWAFIPMWNSQTGLIMSRLK